MLQCITKIKRAYNIYEEDGTCTVPDRDKALKLVEMIQTNNDAMNFSVEVAQMSRADNFESACNCLLSRNSEFFLRLAPAAASTARNSNC